MQTAAATTAVVDTPAGICADLGTAVDPAAPFNAAAVAMAGPPGMGSGSPAVGLDRDLTVPTALH
jgi:hypothetical protein